MVRSFLQFLLFKFYQVRFRKHLAGWSFISNNCIGGTLSRLADDAYNSPTAGLWLTADGYRDFCAAFPAILHQHIHHDTALSAQFGYPVGDLAGVKLMFQHYETFDEAVEAWRRRIARINYDKLLFVCAVRDEFDDAHLNHFRALSHRRLLLTNSFGKDERFAAKPAAAYRVEDLHSWRPLARTLSAKRLAEITR